MELFSLLAKLTLDSKQYMSALDEAQDAAEDFESPDGQELELDNSEYTGALDEAEDESESFSGSVQSIFKNLKGVLAGLGIATLVTGVVSTLKEGVNLAKEHGDTIDKQSKKMRLSAEAYQEWGYALDLNGASINDLNRGMRNWQAAVGDENKTKDLSDAFEAIGISAKDAFEQISSGGNLDNLLNSTIMGLARMNPGDRGLIGKTLFGNSWNELNPLLENSAAAIKDMKDEAHDLGMIMSDEEVANAAAYTDAISRLEGSLQGIKEAFAADLLPVLTDAANTVAKIVAFFNPRNGSKTLSEQWVGDDKQLAEDLVSIEATATAAQSLADKLIAMGDTSKMTADQYTIWKETASELIGMVPTLGEVIDTETGQITGNTKAISENIKEWERREKVKAIQALKEKKQQDIIDKNQELILATVDAVKAETKAEEAKVKAYQKFSDTMKDRGYGELDFKGDVDKQISDLMDSLAEKGDEAESDALALGLALEEIGNAGTEVGKAHEEVEKLTKQLDQAKQDLADWEAAADKVVAGLTGDAGSSTDAVNGLQTALDNLPSEKHITISVDQVPGFPQAKGNWTVPYDNYPSLLHRGEMVLNKSQARQFRDGEFGGNGDVGSLVASAVEAAMNKVYVMLNGDKVGDLTTKRIAKNINASSYNKIRAMGG